MSTTGQDLLEIANNCWVERRGEYAGVQFNRAVKEAMRQLRVDDKASGKKRKRAMRREEAVSTVTAMFDTARRKDAEQLEQVAMESRNSASDDNLEAFAEEVMEELRLDSQSPHSASPYGVIDISMIVTLITAIIQAVQACKKPAPTPPTPVV